MLLSESAYIQSTAFLYILHIYQIKIEILYGSHILFRFYHGLSLFTIAMAQDKTDVLQLL